MANAEILKKYLVDEDNGYLLDSNNNGKVIMLSGKWGSGKTHFWKNIIATDNFKKELTDKNSAYSYVSLYGKSSIEEIENDIFAQTYFCAIGGDNLVTKTFSTFTKYSKRYGEIFSDKVKNLANGLEEAQKENQERVALERLKNGAIICFDDFERKSKDIDLNDLFGFITQLTLNFDCKVVIILNDDVFKGVEKDVFSNVKEKSVSKFLKYEPSIEELFETIFNSDERYRVLDEHKEIILKTTEETEELNARIYIQVLDNLVEWIKIQDKSDDVLRCLILVNINFVLYHKVFELKSIEIDDENNNSFEPKTINVIKCFVKTENSEDLILNILVNNIIEKNIDIGLIKSYRNFKNFNREIPQYVETLIKDKNLISSMIFNKLDISKNVDEKTFQKINNFIETGILINE
jgi:hypothetical protein